MSGWKHPSVGDKTLPLESLGHGADGLCLLVFGDGAGGTFALPDHGRVTVGRGPLCDVFVPAPTISRTHAAIEIGPPLRVRDLDSANGVFVRGRRLAPREAVEIAPGDVLEFGSVTAVVQRRGTLSPGDALAETGDARPTRIPPSPAPPATPGSAAGAVIVQDPAMRRVFDLIQRIGPSDLSVLVLGETGAGKEIIAESVHRASARASGPFLRLNCAALSPTLLESELFGHEKGSFTGASQTKAGLLESADGGTVFLDEAGELPMPVQIKLLRVLEERMVLRVGGLKPRPIDVRFVAATNRDLKAEIVRGTFRQDLYYRLNGITVEVPPLRARTSEIEPLTRYFAQRAAARAQRPPAVFSPAALAALRGYAWPGNVRELRNVVERAVLLAGDEPVALEHLPDEITTAQEPTTGTASALGAPAAEGASALDPGGASALRSELGAFERQRIIDALEKCGGNQTRAAELLGVSRRTLVTKLGLYQIPRRGRDGG